MKKSDELIRVSNNSYMKFVATGNVILVTVFSFAFFLPDVPKWFFALLLILFFPSFYSSLSSINSFIYPAIFYNERSCIMAKFSKKNAVDYKNIIYVKTVKQNFFIRLYREYSWNFLPVLRIGYLDENGIEKSVDFFCKHPLKNAKLNKFIENCKKHNNHFTTSIKDISVL